MISSSKNKSLYLGIIIMLAIFWPNIMDSFHSGSNNAPLGPSRVATSIADKTHSHIRYMLDSKIGSYAYKLIVLPNVKQKSEKSQIREFTPKRTNLPSVQKLDPVVIPINDTVNPMQKGETTEKTRSSIGSKKNVIKRSLPGFPVYLSSLKHDSYLASDEINLEAKNRALRGEKDTVIGNETIYFNQTITSSEVKAGELEFLEIRILVASGVLKQIDLSTEKLEEYLEENLTIQDTFEYKLNITDQDFYGFSYQIGSFLNTCERYANSKGVPIWLVIVASSILLCFSSYIVKLIREVAYEKRQNKSESVDPLIIPKSLTVSQGVNDSLETNDDVEIQIQISDKEIALIQLVEQKPKAIAKMILGWVDA